MADNRVNVQITADDKATEKVERLQKQTDKTTQSMRSMATSMLSGALAGFSFQYALSQVDQRVTEIDANQERTAFIISLMPANIQQAYDEMKPHFANIAADFGFMADDAELAYGTIVSASEGVEPSQRQLAAVLAISALTGKSVEEVALAMGEALNGNIKPLQDLSGTHESMNTIVDRSIELAKDEFDAWDRLKFLFDEVQDTIAGTVKEFALFATSGLGEFILTVLNPVGKFLTMLTFNMMPMLIRLTKNVIKNLKDSWEDFKDAMRPVTKILEDIGKGFNDYLVGPLETAYQWILDIIAKLPDLSIDLPSLPSIGDFNPFASTSNSGGGGNTVIVNNPVVDNDVRQAELARAVADQLRLISRSGGQFT